MSKIKVPADGKITSGRGIGDYVYCLDDVDYYPMRLKFSSITKESSLIIIRPIYRDIIGQYLFDNVGDAKKYFSFTPETVAKIEILASSSTGPSASDFVAGTLLGGVALGVAAAMKTVGSQHTVKVTWRDDHDSKESIITFDNSTGFQTFIGKLGSLMNQPNEATPAISSPVTSSADEIMKFKKLMDEGIINQAEFEAKKKQLLGIDNTGINPSKTKNTNINPSKTQNSKCYDELVRLAKSMVKGEITRAEFEAKKNKLLGIDNTGINPSKTKNTKLYSVVLPNFHYLEIFTTTSITEAEKVAKRISAAKGTVVIRQKKAPETEYKETAEKAKKRFDDYWEAHSEERKELEAEQKALREQISNLNASINEQAAALKKEIAAIPGKSEIDNLDARIKNLSDDIAALGLFKGKEKKALQDQIVQAEADKRAVQKKMSEAKAALEENAASSKRDILGKISQLQSRVKSIETELNKAR